MLPLIIFDAEAPCCDARRRDDMLRAATLHARAFERAAYAR